MDLSVDLDSPDHFIDHSTAPHGTIPAEQGRSLIDEHDADVSNAGHDLNNLLQQAYSTSQSHFIALKKRLLEEKRIELLEMERKYLNNVDQLNNEIQQLKQQITNQHAELGDSRETKEKFNFRAATSLSKYSVKYSGSMSLSKVFRAWKEETKSTLRSNKLDKVAFAFARKHILSKAFFTMCLNLHIRKANKQNAEAKFKFDSVTSEMITSYESQLHAMKVDLREAYLSIEAEQLRRQQLEEDLRRLFLKNMTAMNFEALSLFQNSHTMVDAVPVPAAVAPVVDLGSPPRPVRRDLNHTPRQQAGGSNSGQKSASKRGSSVPRAVSTPQLRNHSPERHPHSPQSHSHQHHSAQQSHYVDEHGHQHLVPSPEQMERQIEQLISSTHTHIPHIHLSPAQAVHYNTHATTRTQALHAPDVRSPPVSTPQPPHPYADHYGNSLSLDGDNALFYTPNEPEDAVYTPTMNPHMLSQMYHNNISSTNKLAHNIRPQQSASFSSNTFSSAQNGQNAEEENIHANSGRKASPHVTRTGDSVGAKSSAKKSVNSTSAHGNSVQGTPASARKNSNARSGSAVKHEHKD